MTLSAITAEGRQQYTPRQLAIIDALRRYAAEYGPDFTAAAFSPSTAKWRDEPELIERYYDAEGVPRWPSLNAIKAQFDGSFNAARVAAGLPPNRPGPSKRKGRAPIRDVSHQGRTVVVRDEKAIAVLERKVERLERRAERAEAAAARRPRAATKPKTVTRRVVDEAAVTRAKARAERAIEKADAKALAAREAEAAARAQLTEARQAAARAAARLERSEATVHELRDERRELREDVRRLELDVDVAKRELAVASNDLAEERASTKVIVKDAPEQAAIDAALAEAEAAKRRAHDAERRAAVAEREYAELAVAAKGEARKLTKGELEELRVSGPSGPALLARGLKQLAAARSAGGNRTAIAAALTAIASAAVSWKERL